MSTEPLAVSGKPLPYASRVVIPPAPVGRWLSVSSVSIFLFIFMFWVMIGTSGANGRELIPIYCLSGLAIIAGAILGLVGMIFRGKPKDRVALIVGIIGLSLNGLVLIAHVVLIIIATLVTIVRLHPTPPTNANSTQVQQPAQHVFNTYQPPQTYIPSPLHRSPQLPQLSNATAGQSQSAMIPVQPSIHFFQIFEAERF